MDGFHEHSIVPGKNRIGRSSDNDIILQDPAASNFHAEISLDENTGGISIRDLNSTNGTFINGKRINRSHSLHQDDQIRIGHSYISIIKSRKDLSQRFPARLVPTKVTGELILESIDQYGVLLSEIGRRLVNIPNLDIALVEIAALVKRMIGAEECQIILENNFDSLKGLGISDALSKNIIEKNSALIFSDSLNQSEKSKNPDTQPIKSMLLAPVMLDKKVVALIFARKSKQAPSPFNNNDLQLVLAVSNQVAMSIQRSRVESELLHTSSHDPLTDLPNRALFLDRLNWSIIRANQEVGFEFAVLFFDIDDFKDVNDSLGHAVGDKLLIAVAERLKHNVRNLDENTVIARFGGDEFAILLDDIKSELYALASANRLKDILSKPYKIDEKQLYATVSIGVAVSSIGYENPGDILRDADMAMYQAKELGKACVEIYDKEMHDRVKKRLNMGTALRQGALQKEFRLHYQPIIALQSGNIVGFEALIRWYTPDRGILNPADFLFAIDTAGLMLSTDLWVLHTACIQTVEWQNKFPQSPPLFISVNLSAKNIRHPNLVKNIKNILQVTKLNPKSLHLEITEKVSAPNDEKSIEVLSQLRSSGIRISLDDFGTGYSALNYLSHMPIDVLKIDQSFIKMIGRSNDSQKVIEMIKMLADHLGITVIAEGVEEAEQISYLQSINCQYLQGYYYAKPLNAQSATELLKDVRQK
ncbi:MAG: EAL domain-containing protein [Anaerolineales bacterium]|jgi:diguanylate cyclase (GGDEF)-like protein